MSYEDNKKTLKKLIILAKTNTL